MRQARAYFFSHKEQIKDKRKGYYKKHYREHKDVLRERRREWRIQHLCQEREADRTSYLKKKKSVIQAYGGCCAVCGCCELAVLTVDHLGNNGCKERREKGPHSFRILYGKPVRKDIQILCFNCNWRKRAYGTDTSMWCQQVVRTMCGIPPVTTDWEIALCLTGTK